VSLVEIDNISHRYPKSDTPRPVLDGVQLTLEANDIVAVVGESGCGKTTLGKIIAGLIEPSDGDLRYDGRDIWALRGSDFKAYRRAVQLVQQDPYGSLNPGLTISDTLGAALLYHKMVSRRGLEAELLRLLTEVGLDATPVFLRRYPHQLSGGQRQRVAIARAMSLRPQLVVADEATSMLDVSMRVSILDLLLSFRAERPLAYLFISHDFGVVRYFAQGGRVLVMFYGKVVEEGPTEEVILRPRHPYTYALLQAIPIPDPVAARRRRAAGVAADYVERPPAETGCVFSTRCPFVEDKCRESTPPLVAVAPDHKTACWFPERVPDLAATMSEGVRHAEGNGEDARTAGDDLVDHVRAGEAVRRVRSEPGR
jgi:oligopeptide/dipeptide ABC transporter ATP-binding protein